MNGFFPACAPSVLWGLAAFCIYLMLLNRRLILIPDSGRKTPIILGAFVLITGGGAVLGLLFPALPWAGIPMAILCLVVLGEIRRACIRRTCAGSDPVDSVPYRIAPAGPVTTTDLVTPRYAIPHPKWEGGPLRIVQISDLHVFPTLPRDYYRKVLDIAEGAEADLAVFTGDFVNDPGLIPELQGVLRPVARVANLAVLGNHDYWIGPEPVRAAVRESGLRLLSNESIVIDAGGRRVRVTGYDYPWGTRATAIASGGDGLLHLVLSHTPDNIYRVARSSADIMFAGHYHAGQIRVPLLGPVVVPSVYGRRFDHGHFVVNGVHLFVPSGVGAVHPPVRIYCRPEIFVVDIMAADAAAPLADGYTPA